jgi:hypothetical protein
MSRILAILIMLFVFSSVTVAADIWVDAVNGDNGNNGSTLLLAKKTLSGPNGAVVVA